jgi:hypothetical protein
MMIPQLLKAGYIRSPWDHMTESMEKSNHHAHKDFQTRTMRGGGMSGHEDPVYLDAFFSFCRLLGFSRRQGDAVDLASRMDETHLYLHGKPMPSNDDIPTYRRMCQKEIPVSMLQVGVSKSLPLLGMRFLLLGRFPGAGVPTAERLSCIIKELGGTVLDKAKAIRIMRSHVSTPHCYVVLKDGKELSNGTRDPIASTSAKKTIVKQTALACRMLAGGDFQFIKYNYITLVESTKCLEDPSTFILHPGPHVLPNKVSDRRALFIRQCKQKSGETPGVSTLTSVKRSRKPKD